MRMLINKLLPRTAHGLALRIDKNTVYASGFREDVDLKALEQKVTDDWLEMARQEALLLVQEGKEEKGEQLKPANFNNLLAKLQLGRLKPEERQRLNAYYDALDAIEAEAETLSAIIANASVADLNALQWPEWMKWTHISEKPEFQFEIEGKVSDRLSDERVLNGDIPGPDIPGSNKQDGGTNGR